VAYVRTSDEAPSSLFAELRALIRSAPSALRPARFYLADEIPRLPSSKLDVHALIALDDANVQREQTQPADDAKLSPTANDRIAQAVARAWQDVLHAPVEGPHDDFFDAGGDSLKAITFATELERVLGLELSPTLLYEAPGFSDLCEVLRKDRAPYPAPLVVLKAGAGSPPLFIIHGVGGHVLELLPAARRMAYRGAVIGIRARGLARGEKLHWSVEAMAIDYLNEIKARQPNGPYYLCGYSSGGLVAFEIARRLEQSGDDVGFVGLLDTSMSLLRWPLRAWLSMIGRIIARLPGNLRVPSLLPASVLRVAASALIASARYRPGFYRGQLTLFAPILREPALPALEDIWRKHARTLSSVETGGDHLSMLSGANAESTAAALTRCLVIANPAPRS
jgi:thioesterase domain-containing protein